MGCEFVYLLGLVPTDSRSRTSGRVLQCRCDTSVVADTSVNGGDESLVHLGGLFTLFVRMSFVRYFIVAGGKHTIKFGSNFNLHNEVWSFLSSGLLGD